MKQRKEKKTTLVCKEEVEQNWYLLDAAGKTLGRFCAEVVKILRGKHKTNFTPHIDTGDGVVIVNAEKIYVSGAKAAQKIYRYHTGFMGGMREFVYRDLMKKDPTYIIWHAVKGMMPKSRLSKQQMRKLRICQGEEHPYEAQKPVKVNI